MVTGLIRGLRGLDKNASGYESDLSGVVKNLSKRYFVNRIVCKLVKSERTKTNFRENVWLALLS